MKKNFTLAFIILLISCSKLIGQRDFRNGFIITLENDTINGMVDYRSNLKNYESCIFKNEQGEIEYLPNQIIGFGYIQDKFFYSQVIKDSFVEALVFGDLSLYKSYNMYHLKKDTNLYHLEFVREEFEINRVTRIREDNKWRGIISYLISDCINNSGSLIENIGFVEKSLTRIIVKYNKCKESEFIEFKAAKQWTKLDYGASIGISRTLIKTQDNIGLFSYLDNSYTSTNPSVGVFISISSPRITDKIAFQSELHFMRSSYSSLVIVNGSITGYHDTFIDLSTISIPLSFNYRFPEKKYGLYIQFGINFDNHIHSETRLLSEQVAGNVVNTFPETSAFEINSNQVGYWGGIGILKSFSRYKGTIAVRYFQMSTLNKTLGFTSNNNRISANLILSKI